MQRISHETHLLKHERPTQSHVIANWLKASAVTLMLSSALLPGISHADDAQRPGTPPDAPPDAPPGHHQRCSGPHGGPGMHDSFGGMGGASGLGMMVHGLKLSDTQETQVFNLVHAQAPRLRENEQLIRKNRKALMDLATARSFDAAKAETLSQAIGQAIASNLLIRTQTNQQIYQLLTSDQKKLLEERRKKFESRMNPRSAE